VNHHAFRVAQCMMERADEEQVSTINIAVKVNGKMRQAAVPPRLLLSDFIRQNLNLPGTHVGCEHGVCGVCNVLLNGVPLRSCLMFAVQADGLEITQLKRWARSVRCIRFKSPFGRSMGFSVGSVPPAC
jgi:aerobic-type carbon monoxide dehydrogenase small subunit (CoxS/CutS family)